MTSPTVAAALEDIYTALNNDNEDIDARIMALKAALGAAQTNAVTVDPARLVHNNRQGRKMMQAYFKKRGIIVSFSEK